MPNSLYCFMFYLFLSTEEQIKDTVYIFKKDIPEEIRRHMPHRYFLDLRKLYFRNRFVAALLVPAIRKIKYPELFRSEIFGLDFNWWLLRGLKMGYVEDCPNVLDIWEKSSLYARYMSFEKAPSFKRMIARFFFGDYYCHPVGTSRLVTAVYTSSPYDKPYHKGKEKIVMRLEEAWNSFPESKKELILRIFNIDEECMDRFRSCKVILLTQPYAVDGHMTEEEQMNVYRKIVSHYGEDNVVIKPHPRDKCDYKSFFPHVEVFDKVVPMQLLVLLGAGFERVATINSSSALSFGLDTAIDWWAEEMERDLVKDEGFCTLQEARQALQKHGQK